MKLLKSAIHPLITLQINAAFYNCLA